MRLETRRIKTNTNLNASGHVTRELLLFNINERGDEPALTFLSFLNKGYSDSYKTYLVTFGSVERWKELLPNIEQILCRSWCRWSDIAKIKIMIQSRQGQVQGRGTLLLVEKTRLGAWGPEAPINPDQEVKGFKRMLLKTFQEHWDYFLYALKHFYCFVSRYERYKVWKKYLFLKRQLIICISHTKRWWEGASKWRRYHWYKWWL